jgi:hypothetical protein
VLNQDPTAGVELLIKKALQMLWETIAIE